jgi:hypothetical protein
MPPATIVARAVFDASGDYPGTSRNAFPVNTAAFRSEYGEPITSMLIEEANITRRLQGYSDRQWVYKGYGLFQYDLQYIHGDQGFFATRQWYDFGECVARVIRELDRKLVQTGDLWEAIRAYNGSGPRARRYRENVRVFAEYADAVIRHA